MLVRSADLRSHSLHLTVVIIGYAFYRFVCLFVVSSLPSQHVVPQRRHLRKVESQPFFEKANFHGKNSHFFFYMEYHHLSFSNALFWLRTQPYNRNRINWPLLLFHCSGYPEAANLSPSTEGRNCFTALYFLTGMRRMASSVFFGPFFSIRGGYS